MTATALGASTLGAFADSSTVPVTLAVVNGTRTLTVTDPTGAAIGNSGLPLGVGHGGEFLVNVTDTNYQHAGYQVSATMTNLYPYAAGNFNFNGTPIPANAVSLGYPSNLLDLSDLETLVTPVVHLTGAINLLGIGLPVNVNQTLNGTTQSVQTLTNAVTKSTLASVLDQLPVTLQTGDTGTFDSAAALPGEPTAHPNPTSKVLMSGDAQSPTASGLLAALNTDFGGKTAQQLVNAGLLDQGSVISAVAQQLGVTPGLLSNGDITTILSGLTGTVSNLTGGILGQTGSYNTLPALSVDVPASASTGVYRGQLVVTLMDK
jgi:hypothetical protein